MIFYILIFNLNISFKIKHLIIVKINLKKDQIPFSYETKIIVIKWQSHSHLLQFPPAIQILPSAQRPARDRATESFFHLFLITL